MHISFCHVLACSALFASVGAKNVGRNNAGMKQRTNGRKACPSSIKERKLRGTMSVVCPVGSIIASAKVEGVNGNCQGTSPALYVQELLCHWKNSCQLTYNERPAYLLIQRSTDQLKLIDKCIAKEAKKYIIEFQCTKDTQVFDMLKRDQTREITAIKGLFRSHLQHPWLYHRADHALTLLNPEHARPMDLVYTFRHLHLWDKDFLTVTWISQGTGLVTTEVYRSDFTLNKENATRIAQNAERVTFTLRTLTSNGGGGFVVCFVWSEPGVKPMKEGVCGDLFQKGDIDKFLFHFLRISVIIGDCK